MFSYIAAFVRWLEYPPWVWWMIAIYLSLPLIFYVILPKWYESRRYPKHTNTHSNQALVMVLGDLGHSPRMLYHVKNLALKKKYKVYVFGYLQSNLPDFIQHLVDEGNVVIQEIPVSGKGGLLRLFTKVFEQHMTLFRLLFRSYLKNSRLVLIQNPPILPLLHVVLLWRYMYSPRTYLIIDWHNLNYSILQMKFDDIANNAKGKIIKFVGFLLVKVMKSYEFYLSTYARYNFTVSDNMKTFLLDNIYPSADGAERVALSRKYMVLRDRPANHFKVLAPSQREQYITEKYSHIFTRNELSSFDFLNRDKVLVSSTSFTKDEDFNILLNGLKQYDIQQLPVKLFLIVTGKGPEKENFFAKIKELQFSENIVVKNYWFSTAEYADIISMADLAISLHLSSSGIDLPMKILDFFGCGIPTISVNFKTISELVKDGDNGFILKENSAYEMCKLIKLATSNEKLYKQIKSGAVNESKLRWDNNWANIWTENI